MPGPIGSFKEYVVVGRRLPTEKEPKPKLYRIRVFTPNEIIARSKFWYYMSRLCNVKRMNGEVLATHEIKDRSPTQVKNYGVWIRYDSRSGHHNIYKEYREMTRAGAIAACYKDMAGRHRARFTNIQILRIARLQSSEVKRSYIKEYMNSSIKFPIPHRRHRPTSAQFKSTFVASRPNTHY